jgi:hemerythrin
VNSVITLEFLPNLRVGVEEIDNQHKELFAHANGFFQAIADGKNEGEIIALFDFLNDYIRAHFGTEEKYMNMHLKANNVYVQKHIAEHRGFSRDIIELTKDIDSWGSNTQFVNEFSSWLRNWYVNHIASTDKALGKLLREQFPFMGVSDSDKTE